jgi:hypothetical protein
VNEVPLTEISLKRFMAVQKEKKHELRADNPATLARKHLDGGDPANKVEFRDEVFLWNAPLMEQLLHW